MICLSGYIALLDMILGRIVHGPGMRIWMHVVGWGSVVE